MPNEMTDTEGRQFEPTPEESVLIPFKGYLIEMEAAKKWGVDLSGAFATERRLLELFGAMVMGSTKRPEKWRASDIRHKFYPGVGQWENFFERWLNEVNVNRYSALFQLGIDIINFSNPYEWVLIDLIGFIYGPEAEEEVKYFIFENENMILHYRDKPSKDLRSPAAFAQYFKMNYDTAIYKYSLN